ncbi:MAG: hypothetical protein IKS75_08195 [Clostridiales bacterium]|nr:hypothetical protein [Clostridiales bacterium]
MNNYDFFIELNNYLGFNFDGPLKLVGNIKGIVFEVLYDNVGTLKAHTAVRLFGDDPYTEHIESAYAKTQAFMDYNIDHENVDLIIDQNQLSEDKAFDICQDLNAFAECLAALMYKSDAEQKDIAERLDEARIAQQQAMIYPDKEELEKHLPDHYIRGMFGAVIGAMVGILLWLVLAVLNYMWPYVLGAIVLCALPIVFYEMFSKEKTSAVEISFCLFITTVALLLGNRLNWAVTLMRYYVISFDLAYREVPFLVEDGIYDAIEYYRDYIIMFVPLAIFYFIVIRNYITGGKSVTQLLKKKKQ